MNVSKNSCAEIEPLLDAYHDGELSGEEQSVVTAHLSGCESCERKLVSVRQVVASLKRLPRIEPGRDFAENFDGLLAARTRRRHQFRPAVWAPFAAAAAVVLAVVAFKVIPGGHFNSTVAENPSVSQPATVGGRHQQQHSPKPAVGPEAPDSRSAVAPVVAGGQAPAVERTPAGPRTEPSAGRDTIRDAIADAPLRDIDSKEQSTASSVGGDYPFDSGSVAVATLAQGGQISVTDALGLETDEDGLYALKM